MVPGDGDFLVCSETGLRWEQPSDAVIISTKDRHIRFPTDWEFMEKEMAALRKDLDLLKKYVTINYSTAEKQEVEAGWHGPEEEIP